MKKRVLSINVTATCNDLHLIIDEVPDGVDLDKIIESELPYETDDDYEYLQILKSYGIKAHTDMDIDGIMNNAEYEYELFDDGNCEVEENAD